LQLRWAGTVSHAVPLTNVADRPHRYPVGTFQAKSGPEGLAQLLIEPADVVLLDLKMPEMTGFELLERITDETSLDGVPAIVLTSAILTPDERQRLRRAARIMSKSDLSGSALAGAITEALGGSPSEAG
jgi:CheY-like chemotaxis protein